MTFEAFDNSNARLIHLSDRLGHAAAAEWIIGTGTKAIAHAVLSYGNMSRIPYERVQFAVRPFRNPDPVEG